MSTNNNTPDDSFGRPTAELIAASILTPLTVLAIGLWMMSTGGPPGSGSNTLTWTTGAALLLIDTLATLALLGMGALALAAKVLGHQRPTQ
ncbi:hypothetical protein DFR67_1161 [Williamsia limnetica]|uniref:Uncharacterized protein n=1 Tax=Williamsia limnetica TaxID=882452 RepID=A0A318RIL5_WILLI|nr:hypothetical protein [Williamsia limnetica]PYE13447.1 hypothetical protein DFR67_1161 [Williamsia limnetica]